jgi:DNA-directed RNA polymerase specialized sigma24 family protein
MDISTKKSEGARMGTEFATTAEAIAAVEQLTDDDLCWLQFEADMLANNAMRPARADVDGADLLQEALIRTITGKRNWRKSVDFNWYLFHAMRSIADAWGKERKKAKTVTDEELEIAHVAHHSQVMRQVESQNRLEEARSHFGDDLEAWRILEYRTKGKSVSDICCEMSITKRQYEAAVKRTQRLRAKLRK